MSVIVAECVKRGQRKKLGMEKPSADDILEVDVPPSGRRPSANWARLIRRVYEVDPLVCPACGAGMRLIAVIDDDFVVRKILKHLRFFHFPGGVNVSSGSWTFQA